MASKHRSTIWCTSSGSRPSAMLVNPAMSANSTLTWRRSPSIADRALRTLSARCFGVYEATRGLTATAAAEGGDMARAVAAAGGNGRLAPHKPQKRKVAATSDPQDGQRWGSAAPHCTQKRMLAGLSNWQLEHLIGAPPSARRDKADLVTWSATA